MTTEQFIEKYRGVLEESLHDFSKHHLENGESLFTNPYRVNIHSVLPSDDGYSVSFQSTLGGGGFSFHIPVGDSSPIRHNATDFMWEGFKKFRNNFLEENYPQIKIPR